ncbi:MAG: aminotransferase class I/II-fold pyridoxal phosphate-dependent enzyme, partial [Rhodobacteraceae bacterium]|nr:aminotransferase class I/II-fold pyridoxal phosphate-dependent enzyme [Paracoccaceae bacterium]
RLTVGRGDPVVTSDGAYPTFAFHVAGHGGQLHRVPYREDREDPGGLLRAARATGARLVYLSNPDNPMGSWHAASTLAAAIADIPDGTLLVLDEAYAEFAPAGTLPPLDPADPRVIRLRTFSKAHGLAGLRVGYAIGHAAFIAAFDRVRDHFGVGRIAQAGALAALGDGDHLDRVLAQVATSREAIAGIARANGLVPVPSAANFVAVDCGRDGAFAAQVLAGLAAGGVFVRKPAVAPQDRCIRISCGRPEDLAVLAAALPAALAAARGEAPPITPA